MTIPMTNPGTVVSGGPLGENMLITIATQGTAP
ncbi:MAG: hypothetical protein RLZ67_483, partial [Actinomycetota bacterium]